MIGTAVITSVFLSTLVLVYVSCGLIFTEVVLGLGATVPRWLNQSLPYRLMLMTLWPLWVVILGYYTLRDVFFGRK